MSNWADRRSSISGSVTTAGYFPVPASSKGRGSVLRVPNRPDLEFPPAHRTDNQQGSGGVGVRRSFAGGSESYMSPLAKRLKLILYLAVAGALFVNYLMGLGWFGRYDKIA